MKYLNIRPSTWWIILIVYIIITPLVAQKESRQDIEILNTRSINNDSYSFQNKDAAFSITAFEDGKLKLRYVEDPDSIMNVIVIFRGPPAQVKNEKNILAKQKVQSAHQNFQNELNQIIQSIKRSDCIEISQPEIAHKYVYALNGLALQTTRRVVDRIYALPMVVSVHPDRKVKTLINNSANIIGADSARIKYDVTGKGILVGVIDTGIDYTHPALGNGIGENFRVVGGYDFAYNDNDPMDGHGHGTWVSGIIGADGDSLAGVAPEVSFLAVKVLNEFGFGYSSDVIAGIEYCIDPDGDPATNDGVDIINLSIGDDEGDANDPVSLAVDQAFANGILCVVAAGNDGFGGEVWSPFQTIASPASARTALAVGASDLNDQIAVFSSRGPAPASFSVKPEIVAPGVDITSTCLDGGFITQSGTSGSAPIVAGAAALLMEHHPDWDNSQVKAALVNSAKRLPGIQSPYVQGNGRLDVLKAFEQSILISPPVVSFGIVDLAAEVWQSQDTLVVNNPTDSSLTLNLYPPELPTGVTFNLSQDNFDLDPGESDALIVTILVSKEVPLLNEDPFSYYGDIVCVAGVDSFVIPCGFTKSRQLVVETSLFSRFLLIWREDSPKNYIFHSSQRFILNLEEGDYRVFCVMKTFQYGVTHYYLVEEKDVSVENLTFVQLNHTNTIFESPPAYYGRDGNQLDPQYFQRAEFETNWIGHKGVTVSFGSHVHDAIIHSTPLDSSYLIDHRRVHGINGQPETITVLQKLKKGINCDKDLSLRDGSEGLKRFFVELPEEVSSSENKMVIVGRVTLVPGRVSFSPTDFDVRNDQIIIPVDFSYQVHSVEDDSIFSSFFIGYRKTMEDQQDYSFRYNPKFSVNSAGKLTTFIKDYDGDCQYVPLEIYQEGDTLSFSPFFSEVLIPNYLAFWDNGSVCFILNDTFCAASIHSTSGQIEGIPYPPDFFSYRYIDGYLFGDGKLKDKHNSLIDYRDWFCSRSITRDFRFDIHTSPYEILGQYGRSFLSLNGRVANKAEESLSLMHFDVRGEGKIRQWLFPDEENVLNFHIRNCDQFLSSVKVMLVNELAEQREIAVSYVDGIHHRANIPDDLSPGFYGVHLVAVDKHGKSLEFIPDPALYFAAKDEQPQLHASLYIEDYCPIDTLYYTLQPDTTDFLTVDVKNIGVETANNIKFYFENSASTGIYTDYNVEVIKIEPDVTKPVYIPIRTTMQVPTDSLIRLNLITEWESAGGRYKRRFYLTFGIASSVPTSVQDRDVSIAKDFVLIGNYPNPVSISSGSISRFRFNLLKSQDVSIDIYNVLGRHVAKVEKNNLPAGTHELSWNGADKLGMPVSNGVYFYKFHTGQFAVGIGKLVVLK